MYQKFKSIYHDLPLIDHNSSLNHQNLPIIHLNYTPIHTSNATKIIDDLQQSTNNSINFIITSISFTYDLP